MRTPTGSRNAHVEFARYGTGRPVLVLHGSGGGWDQGADWAQRRLTGDVDVIAVSRFGYLGSALPQAATVEDQADVLIGLLDHLGLDAVDVVGFSAGSVTAVVLAARHAGRVRSLVLESPMLPTRRPVRLPPPAVLRMLARAEPVLWWATRSPVLSRLAAGVSQAELGPAERAELAEINATQFPIRPRLPGMIFDRITAVGLLSSPEFPAEAVTAPTLVVNAAHAILTPHDDAAAWIGRLPEGHLVDIPNGGHVLIGNVQHLRSLLSSFLADPTGNASE